MEVKQEKFIIQSNRVCSFFFFFFFSWKKFVENCREYGQQSIRSQENKQETTCPAKSKCIICIEI